MNRNVILALVAVSIYGVVYTWYFIGTGTIVQRWKRFWRPKPKPKPPVQR